MAPPLVCFQPLKIGARLALGRARSRLAVCAGKTGPGRLRAGVHRGRILFPKKSGFGVPHGCDGGPDPLARARIG